MKPLYPLYITVEKILQMSSAEREELRQAIKTDLFFLSSDVLRDPAEPPMVASHARIAKQFIVANEEPADTWSETKGRFIVAARGLGKTTLIPCSIVQNLLAYRDIRMTIFGSTQPAARKILEVVERHVMHPVIQHLWPALKDASFANDQFWSPLRTDLSLKDPTVGISSLNSNFAGLHGEILYIDDPITDKNASEGGIERAVKMFDGLQPIMEGEGGYAILTGTRWSPDDIIGAEMAAHEAHPEVSRRQFFVLPIMKVRNTQEAERRRKQGYEHLLESDVTLTWPENENFSFEKIHAMALKPNFASQYMLEVSTAPDKTTFTDEMWQKALMSWSDCPKADVLPFVTNWGWAGITGVGDAHAGVTVMWDSQAQTFIIVDIVCEKFASVPERLASVASTHQHFADISPYKVMVRVENARSADEHDQALRNLGVEAFFEPPKNINYRRAKSIENLWTLMTLGRVRIAANCRNRDVLEYQLKNYRVDAGRPPDDVIDSLAQGIDYCLEHLSGPPQPRPPKPDPEKRQLDESSWPEVLTVKYVIRELLNAGIMTRPCGSLLYAYGGEIEETLHLHNNRAHKEWFRRVQAAGVRSLYESGFESGFGRSVRADDWGNPEDSSLYTPPREESSRPEDIADIEWLRAQTVGGSSCGSYGSKTSAESEPPLPSGGGWGGRDPIPGAKKKHWTDF